MIWGRSCLNALRLTLMTWPWWSVVRAGYCFLSISSTLRSSMIDEEAVLIEFGVVPFLVFSSEPSRLLLLLSYVISVMERLLRVPAI